MPEQAYTWGMRANEIGIARIEPEEDDLFEMANLYPRDTGLPMTVWVSPKGHARHDVRVKVCLAPGDRMDADHTAVVAVRPEPRLVHGELPPVQMQAVARWIEANRAALVDYRDGRMSTVELARGLRKI
jgi:hypothetical protein